MENYKYGFNDKPKLLTAIPLSMQHVFSAFAGTMSGAILVAVGMGLSLSETAFLIQCSMLIAGVSTILQSMGIGPVGSRLPIVTGGSFTFVAPLIALSTNNDVGIAGAFGAVLVGSLVLTLVGPFAVKYLHKYFTPTVTGSVVLAVGLSLMSSSFDYAISFDVHSPDVIANFSLAVFTLVLTLILNQFGKGFLKVASIIISIVIGYIVAVIFGMVDFSSMEQANWLAMPKPIYWGLEFNLGAIITICAIHIVTVMEIIGDTTGVVSSVENRLPTQKELMRAIRADGVGSCFAALFNGLPVISGSPNIGIICMTGVASRYIVALGGVILGILAFFPKFAQILALTPDPVIGGTLVMMFGTIASSGIKVIGMGKMTNRNITILAVSLGIGMGGYFNQAALAFLPSIVVTLMTGISGTALLSLILNIILPKEKEEVVESEVSCKA
ncbi:uracil-xanthine permease [Clostridioides difficile]|nr:uracil-xanthine permease [Clostridioides difficile]